MNPGCGASETVPATPSPPEGTRRPGPCRPAPLPCPETALPPGEHRLAPKKRFRPARTSSDLSPGPSIRGPGKPRHRPHKSEAINSAEETPKLTLSKTRWRPHVLPRSCVTTLEGRIRRLNFPQGRRFCRLHFRRPGRGKERGSLRMLGATYALWFFWRIRSAPPAQPLATRMSVYFYRHK